MALPRYPLIVEPAEGCPPGTTIKTSKDLETNGIYDDTGEDHWA